MTIKELIADYLDQERQNVFLCAADYRMNSHKRAVSVLSARRRSARSCWRSCLGS